MNVLKRKNAPLKKEGLFDIKESFGLKKRTRLTTRMITVTRFKVGFFILKLLLFNVQLRHQ
jgi:hypothetical protein